MSEEAKIIIKVRDRRRGGWFYVNNAVYDLGLSCEAMALYCSLARYANNETESAYFSGKKFKSHHGIGHDKLEAARTELLMHGLIVDTGMKTKVGAVYYDLLEVADPVLPQDRVSKEAVSCVEIGGCADAEEPPVLRQNTNKTIKSRLTKKKSAKADGEKSLTEIQNEELAKAIEYIEKETGSILKADKWLKIWWYDAIKLDGLDELKKAIRNFCHNDANKKLKRWDWMTFFRVQAKRSNFLPERKSARALPEPSHLQDMTPEEKAAHRAAIGG